VPRCAQLIQTLCFASASKLRRDSALRTHFERQGKALINFKTSKPDNVHYSLDCTNGHFSGAQLWESICSYLEVRRASLAAASL
jgi:hypothetical protein